MRNGTDSEVDQIRETQKRNKLARAKKNESRTEDSASRGDSNVGFLIEAAALLGMARWFFWRLLRLMNTSAVTVTKWNRPKVTMMMRLLHPLHQA